MEKGFQREITDEIAYFQVLWLFSLSHYFPSNNLCYLLLPLRCAIGVKILEAYYHNHGRQMGVFTWLVLG
jgi:hypothetical protein